VKLVVGLVIGVAAGFILASYASELEKAQAAEAAEPPVDQRRHAASRPRARQ